MPARRSPICLAAVVGFFAAAPAVRAELIKVSPFLLPQGSASAATPNAPLEYSGSVAFGDSEQYRVYDPARKVGVWLKMGERDPNLDVVIKQHDTDQDTLTVEHGGQTMTLPIHSGKVASAGAMPSFTAGAAMPPMPNVSPAVINTVVPNPTPADEERRLQAVAAEVARRRAMREQAAQQQAMQAGQPAPYPNPANATRQDLQQLQQNFPRRQ